mmetsp:Transcript_23097/g.46207  ORF Transcript_23097/g.46207 Transcript_23097/m.46207 type:complete len:230 (-) Transcript_23097:498-1187(-)
MDEVRNGSSKSSSVGLQAKALQLSLLEQPVPALRSDHRLAQQNVNQSGTARTWPQRWRWNSSASVPALSSLLFICVGSAVSCAPKAVMLIQALPSVGWSPTQLAAHALVSCAMVTRALASCGATPLLLIGACLCSAGICAKDERTALVLVVAGAPLAISSFCQGLAAAKGGDSEAALYLSRCLLLAGFFFSLMGLHLAMPLPQQRETLYPKWLRDLTKLTRRAASHRSE